MQDARLFSITLPNALLYCTCFLLFSIRTAPLCVITKTSAAWLRFVQPYSERMAATDWHGHPYAQGVCMSFKSSTGSFRNLPSVSALVWSCSKGSHLSSPLAQYLWKTFLRLEAGNNLTQMRSFFLLFSGRRFSFMQKVHIEEKRWILKTMVSGGGGKYTVFTFWNTFALVLFQSSSCGVSTD